MPAVAQNLFTQFIQKIQSMADIDPASAVTLARDLWTDALQFTQEAIDDKADEDYVPDPMDDMRSPEALEYAAKVISWHQSKIPEGVLPLPKALISELMGLSEKRREVLSGVKRRDDTIHTMSGVLITAGVLDSVDALNAAAALYDSDMVTVLTGADVEED